MALTTVSLENLDNLQVDSANHLYWMGERIVTNVTLTLPWWADCAILAVGVVAVLNYLGVTPATVRAWFKKPPQEGQT
jgi:hypothetical protein